MDTSLTTSNVGKDSQNLKDVIYILNFNIIMYSVNGKLLRFTLTLHNKQCQSLEFGDSINLLQVSIEVPSHLIWHHKLQKSHCIAFWLLKTFLLHILHGNFK